MINQQLLDYVKQQLQQGVSKEQVKNSLMTSDWQAQDISSLMTSGWQAQDIEEAFSSVLNSAGQSSVVSSLAPTISFLPGVMVILGQAWDICFGSSTSKKSVIFFVSYLEPALTITKTVTLLTCTIGANTTDNPFSKVVF